VIKEILYADEDITTLEVQAGELVNVRKKKIARKGARLFRDGKIYSANYLGNIDDEALLDIADRNEASAISCDYTPNESIQCSERFLGDDMDIMEFRRSTESILETLRNDYSEFVFSGKLNIGVANRRLHSSAGVDVAVRYGTTDGYFVFKRKGSPNIMDGYFGCESAVGVDYESALEFHSPYLRAFDDEAEIETGKQTVCFLASEPTLFKKIIESVNPHRYHTGAALYSNRLNETLFNPGFSMIDANVDPENAVVSPFDDEGTLRKAHLPVIDGGVFKNVLYDLRSAKLYGAKTTGNGARAYNSAVQPAPLALQIAGGEKSISQLLAEQKSCVVILVAGGGDTTSTGDFSTPVQLSYLVENGEVKGRLPQLTLSANTLHYLGDDFIDVSTDRICSGMGRALFCRMNLMLN
jgi:PmbA protein